MYSLISPIELMSWSPSASASTSTAARSEAVSDQLVDDRELEQAGESDQRHQDQRAAGDPGGERHVR